MTTRADHFTPRDELSLVSPYQAPRGPLEARLAEIWSHRLRVDPIGVHDDFFELGGHSLMAADLLADIERELGVEVPATTLYLQPTVADLTSVLSGDAPAGGPSCD